MPISHLGISTTDIATSKKFYDAALAPLRYKIALQFNDGKVLGYGDEKGPSFWVHEVTDLAEKSGNVHVAFDAKSEEEVKAFYDAAMYVPSITSPSVPESNPIFYGASSAAGGKDNGAPGPRPQYTANYYGAFVHDPEGNNIEAVYFAPIA
jgi:catechol 2,3-dioxygenase-like lactoylglutathione lyase family enzyme